MHAPQTKRSAHLTIPALLLATSFLVALTYTKDAYQSLLTKQDDLASLSQQSVEKKRQLDALNQLKSEALSQSGARDDILRYASPYREDEIIDSVFRNTPGITISSITMGKGDKLPSGLSQASVSLSLRAADIASLTAYLDTLTSPTEKKRFSIRSLGFPLDTASVDQTQPIAVSLELATYYLD